MKEIKSKWSCKCGVPLGDLYRFDKDIIKVDDMKGFKRFVHKLFMFEEVTEENDNVILTCPVCYKEYLITGKEFKGE